MKGCRKQECGSTVRNEGPLLLISCLPHGLLNGLSLFENRNQERRKNPALFHMSTQPSSESESHPNTGNTKASSPFQSWLLERHAEELLGRPVADIEYIFAPMGDVWKCPSSAMEVTAISSRFRFHEIFRPKLHCDISLHLRSMCHDSSTTLDTQQRRDGRIVYEVGRFMGSFPSCLGVE